MASDKILEKACAFCQSEQFFLKVTRKKAYSAETINSSLEKSPVLIAINFKIIGI